MIISNMNSEYLNTKNETNSNFEIRYCFVLAFMLSNLVCFHFHLFLLQLFTAIGTADYIIHSVHEQ